MRTHGRGPAHRTRAELRDRRRRRSSAVVHAITLGAPGWAPMGIDAPFYVDTIVPSVSARELERQIEIVEAQYGVRLERTRARVLPAPPWYRRAWNSIVYFWKGL